MNDLLESNSLDSIIESIRCHVRYSTENPIIDFKKLGHIEHDQHKKQGCMYSTLIQCRQNDTYQHYQQQKRCAWL